MTWKDIWVILVNIIIFWALFGSALALDDPMKATRRMVQALCWLGIAFLLLTFRVLHHLDILIPIGAMP